MSQFPLDGLSKQGHGVPFGVSVVSARDSASPFNGGEFPTSVDSIANDVETATSGHSRSVHNDYTLPGHEGVCQGVLGPHHFLIIGLDDVAV